MTFVYKKTVCCTTKLNNPNAGNTKLPMFEIECFSQKQKDVPIFTGTKDNYFLAVPLNSAEAVSINLGIFMFCFH